MTPEEQAVKRLDLAIQTRNFEIELFWKRSLFFWGFIAAAFAGFAALRQHSAGLAIVIACFGTVCSFAWALVTRGSKYSQENWESKVEDYEADVIGPFFADLRPIDTRKGTWLRARRFSVSKISIALSDYVFLLWLGLLSSGLFDRYAPVAIQLRFKDYGLLFFVFYTLIFLALILIQARSSRPTKKRTAEADRPPFKHISDSDTPELSSAPAHSAAE